MRLFVVDGSAIEEQPDMEGFKKVFINPQMIEELGTPWEYEEGASAFLIFVKRFPVKNGLPSNTLTKIGIALRTHLMD